MSNIKTFDYLPKSLRVSDTSGDLSKFMSSIDTMISDISTDILSTSWDIENASRDDLNTMALSLGLFPDRFFTDDLMKKYIRSAGKIRELKGTDDLTTYLVDNLTHFKVYDIFVDPELYLTLRIKVIRQQNIDYDVEERLLDYLIDKYKRLSLNYAITYVIFYQSILGLSDSTADFKLETMRERIELLNFEPYTQTNDQPFLLNPLDNNVPATQLLNFIRNDYYSISEVAFRGITYSGMQKPVFTFSDYESWGADEVTMDIATVETLHTSTVDDFGNSEILSLRAFYTPFDQPLLY